jgi:sphingomyelin phosphodiesterase
VNRFESTITAQFFGHTHQDEFELFYNTEADPNSIDFMRPTNIAYICPSVTTFGNVNPGYRIYTIDGTYRGSTFSVVDHETHFLNLTLANMNRDPKLLQFDKSYSVKQEFQMSDLNPIEWHNLVMRMEKDDALFQRFYNLFFNRSDHIARKVCSDGASCAYNILCRLVTARSHDSTFCQRFLTKP